jgi:hypothetical protein
LLAKINKVEIGTVQLRKQQLQALSCHLQKPKMGGIIGGRRSEVTLGKEIERQGGT